MNDYYEIAQKIKDADAILIGASNGLSITEGLNPVSYTISEPTRH